MRRIGIALLGAALFAGAAACTSEPTPSGQGLWTEPGATCRVRYAPLKVGLDYVGSVDVINTGTELLVEVSASGGWSIGSATLYVGTGTRPSDARSLPFSYDYTGGPTARTLFRVSLSEIGAACGASVWIGVAADVMKDGMHASAWAKDGACPPGTPLEGQTFEYVICCEGGEPDGGVPPSDGGVPPSDGGVPPEDAGHDEGCTRTQGYWKNHPSAWPVDTLRIGDVDYTRDELIAIMETPTRGDASLILAKQLIAARLNVEAGASADMEVTGTIDDAQHWMIDHADADGRLPYGVAPSSSAGHDAVDLADTLDAFNNGRMGPRHCD